jgi:hypothetical protein
MKSMEMKNRISLKTEESRYINTNVNLCNLLPTAKYSSTNALKYKYVPYTKKKSVVLKSEYLE